MVKSKKVAKDGGTKPTIKRDGPISTRLELLIITIMTKNDARRVPAKKKTAAIRNAIRRR